MITKHTKVVGSIALLLFIGSVLAFSGLFIAISSAREELKTRQVEVAKAHEHERQLAALARLVEESTQEREQLASYMLYEEDTIDFLSLLEDLAREQGVGIEIASINVSEIDEDFEELQISISLEGEYAALVHMLTLLETLPYQAYVGSANVSKQEESEIWTGTLTLHVVKYKEQ